MFAWIRWAWCAFRGHQFPAFTMQADGRLYRECPKCGAVDQW